MQAPGPFPAGTDERRRARHTRVVADDEQETDASEEVRRAREDLESGREWRARDVLADRVAREYDVEALELLGEVHAAMRDLPAAGAAWFGTRRRGEDVDAAVAAWREQHGDRFASMWSSLPRPVREHGGNVRVDALRRRVEQAGLPTGGDQGGATGADDDAEGVDAEGVDAAVVIAVGVAVLFVVCAVVGFVQLVRWLVPGV
jgi:hypothetical protein